MTSPPYTGGRLSASSPDTVLKHPFRGSAPRSEGNGSEGCGLYHQEPQTCGCRWLCATYSGPPWGHWMSPSCLVLNPCLPRAAEAQGGFLGSDHSPNHLQGRWCPWNQGLWGVLSLPLLQWKPHSLYTVAKVSSKTEPPIEFENPLSVFEDFSVSINARIKWEPLEALI